MSTFRILDSKTFSKIFMYWVLKSLKKEEKILTTDRKVIKSNTDKINKGNTPYTVSSFLTNLNISIVIDKYNEIPAIPELLKSI